MAGGGSIIGVTINSRYFPVDKDCDATIYYSGYTNEKKENGDGSTRNIKKRKAAGIKGLVLSMDNDRGDLEFLQETANSFEDVDVDISLVDGTVKSGSMMIEGDFEYKTMDSTCDVELKGTLEQQ